MNCLQFISTRAQHLTRVVSSCGRVGWHAQDVWCWHSPQPLKASHLYCAWIPIQTHAQRQTHAHLAWGVKACPAALLSLFFLGILFHFFSPQLWLMSPRSRSSRSSSSSRQSHFWCGDKEKVWYPRPGEEGCLSPPHTWTDFLFVAVAAEEDWVIMTAWRICDDI